MVSRIDVSRARRQDVPEIVEFLNRTRPGKPITEAELLETMLTWGALLARTTQLRGILCWQASNLVGVVRRFWIWPRQQQRYTGGALLQAVEKAAYDLFCDGVLILAEPDMPASTMRLLASRGYKPLGAGDLSRYWQEAVEEVLQPNDQIIGKRIRRRIRLDDSR